MVQGSEGGSRRPTWSNPVSRVAEISIPGTRGRLKRRESLGRAGPRCSLAGSPCPWQAPRGASEQPQRPMKDLGMKFFIRILEETHPRPDALGRKPKLPGSSERGPIQQDSPAPPTAPHQGHPSPQLPFWGLFQLFSPRRHVVPPPYCAAAPTLTKKRRGLCAAINPSPPACQRSELANLQGEKKRNLPRFLPRLYLRAQKRKHTYESRFSTAGSSHPARA